MPLLQKIQKQLSWKRILLAQVLLIILLALTIYLLPDGQLRLHFLNVGQGDAILIRTGLGQNVLIDGGPDSSVLSQLDQYLPFYDRQIELIILSHPHADHLNGLLDLYKKYQIKNLLLTGVNYDYVGYTRLLQLARRNQTNLIFVQANKDYSLGKLGFDIIYPLTNIQGQKFNNVNNSSIVFRLIYGQQKFFFSGDLELEKEQEILEHSKIHQINLSAGLLKAGHHGSKTSNHLALIQRIHPEFAIISCGINNSFKHPYPGTLENFSKIKATVFRTDLDGTVILQTDGFNSPKIKTGQ